MNILLAVDGSSYTKKMLAYIAAHDELLGTQHQYSAITVQTPLPARARAVLGKARSDEYHADNTEKVLVPVEKFLARKGITIKRIVKLGSAGELIGKTADAGSYDLLVMGSHGHNALATLVMGSVTTQVLAHSKVPVLIVR